MKTLLGVSVLSFALVGTAAAQSFTLLTLHAVNALSRDGRTGVGTDPDGRAMSWTAAGGINVFGTQPPFGSYSFGSAVSDNGAVMAGTNFNDAQRRLGLFRWSDNQTFQALGLVPGMNQITATSMSANGDAIVGWGEDRNFFTAAFIWTPQGGLREIPGAGGSSQANDITADGSMVIGQRVGADTRAFTWTANEGLRFLQGLTADNLGGANGVSADGRYIVGGSRRIEDGGFLRSNAVMWTNRQIRNLGRLDGYANAYATDVSDDGSVVVGILSTVDGNRDSFVWTEATGMMTMRDYLASNGMVVQDFLDFNLDPKVSGDGLTIAGTSSDMTGQRRGGGYIATIPAPGVLFLTLATPLFVFRSRRRC